VFYRKGSGNISASGGNGLAGGGGGRISVDVFSRHDDIVVSVHGIGFLIQWLKIQKASTFYS
jgi:Na+/serine symporter